MFVFSSLCLSLSFAQLGLPRPGKLPACRSLRSVHATSKTEGEVLFIPVYHFGNGSISFRPVLFLFIVRVWLHLFLCIAVVFIYIKIR